jgi:NAD(P)-dependent dehydrogenase (short-subunit alcohol dehydrogenase family)
MYNFTDKTIVMTGGTGVLGKVMSRAFADCGANVVILSRSGVRAKETAKVLSQKRGKALAIACDVTKKDDLKRAGARVVKEFGRVDSLVNAAGGNSLLSTTSSKRPFWEISREEMKSVYDLNLMSTIFSCQVFGEMMAGQREGSIVNISSMTAFRPMTRVAIYSAAKAAVTNFTQWLAVYMAQEFSPNIRVNALVPGFFLTDQNRFLLTDTKSGNLTERGRDVLAQTPMGRFGEPEDLVGAILWLLSPSARFVTGAMIPVDGGFSAYAGV